jgi:hypothetical protein
LGIIFHYKPDSDEYFPQCLSQKFTIYETDVINHIYLISMGSGLS